METLFTSTSITEGQKKQYERLIKDTSDKALAEAGLDKDGLQRVIRKGDDLQTTIMVKLRELSVVDKYASKGIAEQINTLRKLFPNLGTADESIASKPLPAGAKGWYAIPRHELVAANYNKAVKKVIRLIKKNRKGNFYWEKFRLGPQYLRQTKRTVQFWEKLGKEQKGHDILIVPCQFSLDCTGLRYNGRSPCRTSIIKNSHGFGLGIFAVGVMLLTHPERLSHHDDLTIDCAGDECLPEWIDYANADDDYFSRIESLSKCTPYFSFSDGNVQFGIYSYDLACGYYGFALGFVSSQVVKHSPLRGRQ